MNDENTRRIIQACPSLFQTIHDEQENMLDGKVFSPIAFCFECGDGWVELLVDLCEKIQVRLNEMGSESKEIVALQVKEKYGTLRFYLSTYDEAIEAFIKEAERKSSCICEQCGRPGSVRGKFWLYTACVEHTREEDLNPIPKSDAP